MTLFSRVRKNRKNVVTLTAKVLKRSQKLVFDFGWNHLRRHFFSWPLREFKKCVCVFHLMQLIGLGKTAPAQHRGGQE
jgi:hypothetical protein